MDDVSKRARKLEYKGITEFIKLQVTVQHSGLGCYDFW